jgi:hypothetical protein
VKAHYPELDLDLVTSGILESNDDGTPVDEATIRQSMLGYDQLCALGMQLNVYYKAYDLPWSQSHASASISGAPNAADCHGFINRSAIGVGVWQFVEGGE